jgi:hypothetical protein
MLLSEESYVCARIAGKWVEDELFDKAEFTKIFGLAKGT